MKIEVSRFILWCALSTAFSTRLMPGTAPWPLRSSGTTQTPSRRRVPAERRPAGRPSMRTISA
jgi:hypothetical protein